MPLLRKTPFIRNEVPSDLKPEDQVFFCEPTKEVFKDYGEFFERIILCNSLVWSCGISNKSGLTFEEAKESETKAKRRLGAIPKPLKKALLWTAHHAKRGRIGEFVDDVYKFCSSRFFLGELVDAVIKDMWCECTILEIIPPTPEEIALETEEENEDTESANSTSPKNNQKQTSSNKKGFFPPDYLYKYKVKETEPDDENDNPELIISAEDIRREKGLYTREKNSLLIKNICELGPDGNHAIKRHFLEKHSVKSIKFEDIFAGPEPIFEETRRQKGFSSSSLASKKQQQATLDGWMKGNGEKKGKKLTPAQIEAEMKRMKEQNEKFKEELKLRADEARKRKTEEKAKEKERKKEEKKLFNQLLSEWTKPREDLLCEDHKDLPHPHAVRCGIPNQLFGDFMMIMEFFEGFSEVLLSKDSFPNGITFDVLESALCETDEISSSFFDVLSFLIGVIFELQGEEEEEGKANKSSEPTDKIPSSKSDDRILYATEMSRWAKKHHGQTLQELHLDRWTITEILRVHFESSGCYKGEKLDFWRYQQRGGYRLTDDPGLQFRTDEPQILEALKVKTVFELDVRDKIKIITCLVQQVITFAPLRDELDERFNALTESKAELRQHQMTENRRIKATEEARKNKLKDDKNGVKEEEEPGESNGGIPLTTRQKEALQAQKEKEEKDQIKKEEYIRSEALETEKTILQSVLDHQSRVNMTCIGRDRSYRRFWIFESIPGIFVENDDEYVGTCLPEPTPHNPNAGPIDEATAMARVKEIMIKREKGESTCDKENEKQNDHNTKNNNKKPKILLPQNGDDPSSQRVKKESYVPIGCCTADFDNCTVHSSILPKTHWSFYYRIEELDSLIENLNPRGIREKELSDKLQNEKSKILKNLRKFNMLDKLVKPEENNVHQNGKTSISDLMDLTLRDQILELEEKIFFGNLGNLRVESREIWQKALQSKEYDRGTDTLTCGGLDIDSRLPDKLPEDKVQGLLCAILQIGQMVEEKYLKAPLLEGEKEKRKRLKDDEKRKKDEEGDENTEEANKSVDSLTPFQLWEISLAKCSSYSSLFLHLTTLENSIVWSKSVMNAKCRICRRKNDPEKMLLCDNCDRGHHMYCLKPKIKSVPSGDWFCSECKPKERIRSPKKCRRVFSEADHDDLEADHEDDEENGSDNEMSSEDQNMDSDDDFRIKKKPKKSQPTSKKEAEVKKKKKGSSIIQLLGQRKCAEEANEKITQSGYETPPPESSGVRSSSRNKAKRSLESSMSNLRPSKKPRTEEIGFDPTILEDILNSMMKHKDGWPFDRPITKTDAQDYFKIVSKPMDLGTIRSGINRMKYASNEQVLDDIRLVFSNCYLYNREDAVEFGCAKRLEEFFLKEGTKAGLGDSLRSCGFSLDDEEETNGTSRSAKRNRRTM